MKLNSLSIVVFALLMAASSMAYPADQGQLNQPQYDAFWRQWHETEKKALSCTDNVVTAKFLSNAITTLGNAEVTEANAESIEKLCLGEPICFLESIQKLQAEEQAKIIRFFLLTPIFHNEEEIRKSLAKHWNKFESIRELYQRLKKDS